MNQETNELVKQFFYINKTGWIQSLRKGPSGIGYTFEKLINKKEENFPIPDYKGIEIKTSRKNSWGKIHLFHATPDGDYLFPIKDIIKVLGYPDKDYPKFKVFNVSVNSKYYTKIGSNKKITIIIDKDKEKIYLIAKNKDNKNYNLSISWSFEMLEKRINLKLKYLALIKADSKKLNEIEYFHYSSIKVYKLKNFNTFIKLIEEGKIDITFMISIYKKGKKFGQIHDHGTSFTINEKYIDLLYEKQNIERYPRVGVIFLEGPRE